MANLLVSEESSDESQWGTEILGEKNFKKMIHHEFSVENILMKKPDWVGEEGLCPQ